MTNRERAERWVADRSSKGFYSPTTTDDLTTLLDEVRDDALSEAAECAEYHLSEERARIVAWLRAAPLSGPAETVYADAIERGEYLRPLADETTETKGD